MTTDVEVEREVAYLRDRLASAERVVAAARRVTSPTCDVDPRALAYALEAHADFLGLRPDPGASRLLRQVDSTRRRERMVAAGPKDVA